jgi:hypothetical protein
LHLVDDLVEDLLRVFGGGDWSFEWVEGVMVEGVVGGGG